MFSVREAWPCCAYCCWVLWVLSSATCENWEKLINTLCQHFNKWIFQSDGLILHPGTRELGHKPASCVFYSSWRSLNLGGCCWQWGVLGYSFTLPSSGPTVININVPKNVSGGLGANYEKPWLGTIWVFLRGLVRGLDLTLHVQSSSYEVVTFFPGTWLLES